MITQPAGTYDNPYYHDNVYGHALELLRRHRSNAQQNGIHLDIGCGYARISKPLIETFAVEYVGIDHDDAAIFSARERGLEIHKVWLNGEDATYEKLQQIVGDRRVAAITMLDTLEHLTDGDAVLQAIRRLAIEHTAFVVISVPNVTHADIGLKLAFGGWNYTDTGLLDHTHVRLFSSQMLGKVMRSAGLHMIEAHDVRKRVSDQHFPEDHPALARGTTLHSFLNGLRHNTEDADDVYQFVRLYVPGPCSGETSYVTNREQNRPFLSIITRTQGKRVHTLSEVFTCLAGQTDIDFEILVVGHHLTLERQKSVERIIEDNPEWLREKSRLLRVDSGDRSRPLNVGFEAAQGHYIAILDDDDIPKANWVETFRELALAKPGRLLRVVATRQTVTNVLVGGSLGLRAEGSMEMRYPPSFDLIQHLRENQTPPIAVAFPRGVFHDLNIRFDETLTTTEDWDYILRVAGLVGTVSSEKVTCIYRWWSKEENSRTAHSNEQWRNNHQRIFQKMDSSLVLFPEGTTARIRQLLDECDQLKAVIAQHRIKNGGLTGVYPLQQESQEDMLRQVDAILNSTSWKITGPIRFVGNMLGRPKVDYDALWRMSPHDVAVFYEDLLRSRSWRLSAPLRRLRKRFT